MTYILSFVVIAIAVVLAIFTAVWGGLVWLVVVGIALAILFLARARADQVQPVKPEPTGRPRGQAPSSGTANTRVGQD